MGRLATEVTSFIDRRTEIAEVKRLLAPSRLLTLVGAAGIGKSRLAVRVASELRRAFADGVWQVDLAGLVDESLLEYTVTQALGLQGAGKLPTAGSLIDHLADRKLLLVLDNCEHVVDACAELIGALLPAAAGLRVLCTTRQPLGMFGETVYMVKPLPVPPAGAVLTPATAVEYPAVVLFVERAAAASPGFTLTADNQDLIVEICDRLDGLPLAIELAAVQLRTLSVRELADGLVNRFGLLRAGPDIPAQRAGPARNRRLQDTFDLSYALCSPAEQRLWRRVAVFGRGFDLEAATAVCVDDDLPADMMLELLAALVDKSVVIRDEDAGQVRYRMLQTIREYGINLDDGSLPVLRRHHRDWYVRLAERFEADWFGPAQVAWTIRLRVEQDNLRAALDFCLATPGDEREALRLTAALLYYWRVGGSLREGLLWLDRALAASTEASPARAAALYAYCLLVVNAQGDPADATARAQEGFDLARHLGDPLLVARALHAQGLTTQLNDEPFASEPLFECAVARFASLGVADTSAVSARFALALSLLARRETARAAAICVDVYAICLARGDRWVRSQLLLVMTVVALQEDDPERATAHTRERLEIKRELGDTLGIVTGVETMAGIATIGGGYERAARLLGAAERVRRSYGQRTFVSSWLRRWREQFVTATRDALGETAFEEATQRGAAMGQDAAVAYALGEDDAAVTAEDPTAGNPLTRRERQVAELIAQGLSNQQIAARLVVSRRTAESHVENILSKLGFSSRTQVAGWISGQRR